VSAATAIGAPDFSDIKLAENKMAQWHQDKLFMIKKNEIILDEALSQSGYRVIDPTNIWSISSKTLSIEKTPPVTAFTIFPPLAIQRELWSGKQYFILEN
jgi:hypothetical protein